jgi:hypothetical protein
MNLCAPAKKRRQLVCDNIRFRLYFHEHIGVNKPRNFNHGSSGQNIAEILAVRFANAFPIVNIFYKKARSDNIVQMSAGFGERKFYIAQSLERLPVSVANTDNLAGFVVRSGRAGNPNMSANAHSARVANDRFPRGACGYVYALHGFDRFLVCVVIPQ